MSVEVMGGVLSSTVIELESLARSPVLTSQTEASGHATNNSIDYPRTIDPVIIERSVNIPHCLPVIVCEVHTCKEMDRDTANSTARLRYWIGDDEQKKEE